MAAMIVDPELTVSLAPSDRLVGVDEVGRGALLGPVVAAAAMVSVADQGQLVALGVRDSKQLSEKKRQHLAEILPNHLLGYGIGVATVAEIDEVNILQASLLAMARAIAALPEPPQLCLVDGNQPIPQLPWPQRTVVKGDRRSPAIAAASILAKVYRDQWVQALDPEFPPYGLAANKGYGTAHHRQAIARYGLTPHHRLSFAPCRNRQLNLFSPDSVGDGSN